MSSLNDLLYFSEEALARKDDQVAAQACIEGLNKNPSHVPLTLNLARSYINTCPFVSVSILEGLAKQAPDHATVWVNLGRAYLEMAHNKPEYYEKAIEASRKAIEIDPEDYVAYINLSFAYLVNGRHQECFKACQDGLRLDKENQTLLYNMSMSFLSNYNWENGWYCYDKTMKARFPGFKPDYCVPRWEGQPGRVIVHGEQGLGDEIMFSSMIPDLQKECEVVIECERRLGGLFRRSFDCEVHATRHDTEYLWRVRHDCDFEIPIGSLGNFYRTENEHFPGKPYLKADPERRVQWKALLDSLGDKPKIGIAWSGGIPNTFEARRSLSIRDLNPILEYDADFISLQYKNTDCPDFVHHWPRATVDCDYDETAALIAELDLFIGVTTTAIHAAGALGVETWCLVPSIPQWRYGVEGDGMVWYDSVELFRQKESGEWPIQALADKLSAMGIERNRNLSTKTPITVLPQKSSRRSSPLSSEISGLDKFLITGLERAG